MMELFTTAGVIWTAQETGLVGALRSGPRPAAAYAEELGLDRRATQLVLETLVALGVACREGDAFEASPRVKSMRRPEWQGSVPLENVWSHVPAFVRTGQPIARMDGAPAEREASYRGAVSGLAALVAPVARALAAKLPAAPPRVLDVGCGAGVWGLSIAERFPGAHVTGLDFPAVLEAFTARAASLNLTDRVATLPGDMHAVPLPACGFDLVVIGNVLRLEQPERARALLARLAAAVAPGGALLVVDALAAGTPERERARALYALGLALRTESARVHSPAAITAWLEEAGLRAVTPIDPGDGDVSPGPIGALLARR
ncbi:class I SAM-dependent methyltransferase [Sorangium sp. So ce321]|uniref:methyltransferase n=1 Tax=Sorangium sp. So ce321 TaxID=3133300 RepID=UPI003F5D677F